MYSHFASYYGPPQNPSQCTSYLDSWTWKTRNKKASDRYGYITRTTIPTAHCAILGRKLPRRQHFQWTRCRTNKNNHTLHTPCTSPYTNERQHTGWTATSPPLTYRGRWRCRHPAASPAALPAGPVFQNQSQTYTV